MQNITHRQNRTPHTIKQHKQNNNTNTKQHNAKQVQKNKTNTQKKTQTK